MQSAIPPLMHIKPQSTAPAAPDHLSGLMQWPDEHIRLAAKSQSWITNLKSWLGVGIGMVTAYSGISAPEVASEALVIGYHKYVEQSRASHEHESTESERKGERAGATDLPGILYIESVEYKPNAQTAILSHELPGPNHLFADLNDRVPAPVQAALNEAEASKGATVEEQERSYQAMLQIFQATEDTGLLFRHGRKRECLRHHGWCVLHDVPESVRVRVHVAGPTCTDYSRRNRAAVGVIGKSARPFLTWAFERRQFQEDMLILENVDQFNVQALMELLGHVYRIAARISMSPESLGWPIHRQRQFIVLISKKSGIIGDLKPEQLQQMFCKKRAEQGLRSDMFYVSPEDFVNKQKQVLLEQRLSATFTIEEAAAYPWDILLSGAQHARKLQYEGIVVSKLVTSEVLQDAIKKSPHLSQIVRDLCAENNVTCIFDLDQNVEFGNNPLKAEALPCLISHGLLYSVKAERPLLGVEALIGQGWPLTPVLSHIPIEYYDLFAHVPDVWMLKDSALKDLPANSIHLAVFHSLFLWCLGTLRMPDPAEHHNEGSVPSQPQKRRRIRGKRGTTESSMP